VRGTRGKRVHEGQATPRSIFAATLSTSTCVDRDLLGISPDELKDVRVLETYVGDERIFTLAGQ
jgi:hypothetical protein